MTAAPRPLPYQFQPKTFGGSPFSRLANIGTKFYLDHKHFPSLHDIVGPEHSSKLYEIYMYVDTFRLLIRIVV